MKSHKSSFLLFQGNHTFRFSGRCFLKFLPFFIRFNYFRVSFGDFVIFCENHAIVDVESKRASDHIIIENVRYINILTWLQRQTSIFGVVFVLYLSLFREFRDK